MKRKMRVEKFVIAMATLAVLVLYGYALHTMATKHWPGLDGPVAQCKSTHHTHASKVPVVQGRSSRSKIVLPEHPRGEEQ